MPEILNSYSPTFNQFKHSTFNDNQGIQTNISTPIRTGLNSDTVQIGGENKTKNKNNTKNILLGLGAATVATLGTVYGVKKYQVKNIKNIQKAFQETFMRDDITVEQTREMLKRYKEIEKIKDRKEYIQALFDEAKKNYGLENSNIKLIFEDSKCANGFCKRDNSAISITPSCSRSHILNTIHHEFRHAKQHNMVFNAYPERTENEAKIRTICDGFIEEMISENMNLKPEDVDAIALYKRAVNEFKENGLEITEKNKKRYEFYKSLIKNENMIPETVSEKDKVWVEKCRDGIDNYTDLNDNFGEYYKNFTEIDARKAGCKINKFVKGIAFDFESLRNNLLLKYFT